MSSHWLRARWRSRGEYFAGFFRLWRDPRIVALVFVLFIIVVWFVRGGNSSDSFDGPSPGPATASVNTVSPDGRYVVRVSPGGYAPDTGRPTVDIIVESTGAGAGAADAPGLSRPYRLQSYDFAIPTWSPDSRHVAIFTGTGEAPEPAWATTHVLAVIPDTVRRLELAADLRPAVLLAKSDPAVTLLVGRVRFGSWAGDTLRLEVTALGWTGEPGTEGSRQAGVECRVSLEAGERALRELRRDC